VLCDAEHNEGAEETEEEVVHAVSTHSVAPAGSPESHPREY
jgi:hypothetical protein